MTVATEHYLGQGGNVLDDVADTWVGTLVSWMVSAVMNHPFMVYFQDIDFQVSDEVCELPLLMTILVLGLRVSGLNSMSL